MTQRKRRGRRGKPKKKRVYSKDKARHIETRRKIENPMQLVTELQNKENIWSNYIDKVVYQGEETGIRPDQDLKYILSYIRDSNTRRSILRFFMRREGYNPFKDPVPTDSLPDNYKIYIERIQSHIRLNLLKIDNLSLQERKVSYLGKEYLCVITKFTKENYNKELFSMGYDMIILQKEGRFLINTNPKLKRERPSLLPIYEKLIASEPDKWYIHGHNHMVMTRHGAVSNLNLRQIIHFFSIVRK